MADRTYLGFGDLGDAITATVCNAPDCNAYHRSATGFCKAHQDLPPRPPIWQNTDGDETAESQGAGRRRSSRRASRIIRRSSSKSYVESKSYTDSKKLFQKATKTVINVNRTKQPSFALRKSAQLEAALKERHDAKTALYDDDSEQSEEELVLASGTRIRRRISRVKVESGEGDGNFNVVKKWKARRSSSCLVARAPPPTPALVGNQPVSEVGEWLASIDASFVKYETILAAIGGDSMRNLALLTEEDVDELIGNGSGLQQLYFTEPSDYV